MEGGTLPLACHSTGSADGTTNHVLQLRLQGKVLLSRALEMENLMFQGEVDYLQERARTHSSPTREH